MGKDSKPKDAGAKGKQAGGGSDENASKGKGKSGKASYGLGTCTYVKGFGLYSTSFFLFSFHCEWSLQSCWKLFFFLMLLLEECYLETLL